MVNQSTILIFSNQSESSISQDGLTLQDPAEDLSESPAEQKATALGGEDPARFSLAQKPGVFPVVQEILSRDEHPGVRAFLAANPSLVPHLQEFLSRDTRVLAHLARNPSLLTSLQEKLARHPNLNVRGYLAQNSALSLAVQEVLSVDPESFVRATLSRNPSLTPSLQEDLSESSEESVRAAVAENPAVVLIVQESLSYDTSELVLGRLEGNPSLKVTGAFSARFVKDHAPWTYLGVIGRADPEVLAGLIDNWEGSIESLVEAANLIKR